MAKKKIEIGDVLKKHAKVIGYLVVTAVLTYIVSELSDDPRVMYAYPVINYILFTVKQELEKEGIVKALKN